VVEAEPPKAKVVEAEQPAEVAISQGADQLDETSVLYGPTKRGDTLWAIAGELGEQKGVSRNSMLAALIQTNPEAFIQGRLGWLKTGFMLWIPSREDVLAMHMPQSGEVLASGSGTGVEVSNGNGRRGMARMVGEYLKLEGARITRITNAEHFAMLQTQLYFAPQFEAEAEQLAARLPVTPKLIRLSQEDVQSGIRVVIGSDLLQHEDEVRRALLKG
jgi:FimV-like protein